MSLTLSDLPHNNFDRSGIFVRLRRHKVRFLLVFTLISSIVILIYMLLPPQYLASGAITVISDNTEFGSIGSPAAEQKLGDPADMDTQIVVVKSSRLMQKMLSRPEVLQAVEEDCEAHQRSSLVTALLAPLIPTQSCKAKLIGTAAVEWLRQHYSITASGRSRVIQISYGSPLAGVAATLVNNLIDTYIMLTTADRQQVRAQAEKWIKGAVSHIGQELHQSELDLENFRREHGLVRGETSSIGSERLSQVSQQLAAADAAMLKAKGKFDQLGEGAANTPETLNNRTIADLKQQLAMVSVQLAKMASSYAPNSPVLFPLEQQQRDLQNRIAQEIERIRLSLQSNYVAASAQVIMLRKQLSDLEHDVSVNNLAEAQVATMVRDNDVRRELYTYLSKKAMDIEAQRRLLTGNVQLVNYAEVPDTINFPKLPLFILAGVVLSTTAAAAAAVMRDRSDPAVRRSIQLESISGARVLGYVPRISRLHSAFACTAASLLDQPSALQEAVRSLYTKCVVLGGKARPRTILLTSASSGEGKSFLTLAMAQFGGRSGRRVLVVEADLRRPNFQTALGISMGAGLVEVLQGSGNYAQVVCKTSFGFDVVLAGKSTVASTELLSNGQIEHFLRWTQDHYDLVLVDSPPTSVLMDAHVLASKVDGVLYCARWGWSTMDLVAQGVLDLRQDGGHVLGLVLGMVQPSEYRLYEPATMLDEPYLTVRT